MDIETIRLECLRLAHDPALSPQQVADRAAVYFQSTTGERQKLLSDLDSRLNSVSTDLFTVRSALRRFSDGEPVGGWIMDLFAASDRPQAAQPRPATSPESADSAGE